MKKGFTEKIVKRVLCFSLAGCIAAVGIPSAVFADEPELIEDAEFTDTAAEPAPIKDSYNIDGVEYYKADTAKLTESQRTFYKSVLEAKNGDHTLLEHWDTIGKLLYLSLGSDKHPNKSTAATLQNYMNIYEIDDCFDNVKELKPDKSGFEEENLSEPDFDSNNMYFGRVGLTSANSVKQAEDNILKMVSGDSSTLGNLGMRDLSTLQEKCGLYQKDEAYSTNGPALYNINYAAEPGNDHSFSILAVLFSDFALNPILPEGTGDNYVTTTVRDLTTNGESFASDARNNTGEDATVEQSLEESNTVHATSEISGTTEYKYGDSLTVGIEPELPVIGNLTISNEFTFENTIQKGWTESKEIEDSKTVNRRTEVSLPPYTGVMIKQVQKIQEKVTRYNCPVSVSYRVRVIEYGYPNSGTDAGRVLADFTENSQAELKKRAVIEKNHVDSDNVNWNDLLGRNRRLAEAVDALANRVPVTSTEASFTEKLNSVKSEIDNKMPTRPLKSVGLVDQSDEVSMNVGKTMRLDRIGLEGLNDKKSPYFGFDADGGKWIITNAKGKELTDNKIAKISEDQALGSTVLKAVAPGTVYLRYMIDENKYNTLDHPNVYAKNSDLSSTAVIRVTVKDKKSDDTVSIKNAKVVLSKSEFTYNGKTQTPTIKTIGKKTLKKGTDYTLKWSDSKSKNAGTYKITITGKGKYKGTTSVTYKIKKAVNTLKVKAGKTKTVTKKNLDKKKKITINAKEAYTVSKNKGSLTYELLSAKKGKTSYKKKFSLDKKGNITVKKGLKKGTYKVKIKVTAKGNTNYSKGSKSVTVSIKVN